MASRRCAEGAFTQGMGAIVSREARRLGYLSFVCSLVSSFVRSLFFFILYFFVEDLNFFVEDLEKRCALEDNKNLLYKIIEDLFALGDVLDDAETFGLSLSLYSNTLTQPELRDQIEKDVSEVARLSIEVFPSLCRFCNCLYI